MHKYLYFSYLLFPSSIFFPPMQRNHCQRRVLLDKYQMNSRRVIENTAPEYILPNWWSCFRCTRFRLNLSFLCSSVFPLKYFGNMHYASVLSISYGVRICGNNKRPPADVGEHLCVRTFPQNGIHCVDTVRVIWDRSYVGSTSGLDSEKIYLLMMRDTHQLLDILCTSVTNV